MNGFRPATGFVIVALQVMAACSSSDARWSDPSEASPPSGGAESGKTSANAGGNDVGGQDTSSGGNPATSTSGGGAAPAMVAGADGQGLGSAASASAAGEAAGGDAGSGGAGSIGTEGCLPGCCGSELAAEAQSSDEVIAESVHGFSDTQGQCGWSYGYLPSGEEPFTPLAHFGKSSSPVWQATADVPPWSAIYREDQHPNQIPLQWIVRRWTSHVQGVISIEGHVAKVDVEGGDGIIAQVRVDGLPRWEVSIAFDDSSGLDFEIAESVVVGSNVDFIVAPKGGDAHDRTSFVATIAW